MFNLLILSLLGSALFHRSWGSMIRRQGQRSAGNTIALQPQGKLLNFMCKSSEHETTKWNKCWVILINSERRPVFNVLFFYREIHELFNAGCAKAVHSGDFLSLDETLWPMHNDISFKYVWQKLLWSITRLTNYGCVSGPTIRVNHTSMALILR